MENTNENRQKVQRSFFPALRKMKHLALLLWPHARNHKILLSSGAALRLMLIVFKLAQPWPIKWIIDILSKSNALPEWLRFQPDQAIVLLSLMYIGVAVLSGITDYWQRILLSGLGNRVIYNFRNKALDHLFRLPVSFHEKRTVGELVTRIVYDTSRLRRGVNGILIRTFQVIFTFMLNVLVILTLNWHIAFIIGAIGTLALVLMNRNGKKILSESHKNRRREGRLAAIVAEDMHGIREFQTFRPDKLSDKRFESKNKKSLSSEQKVRRIAARMSAQVEILLASGICIVLWIGAMAVNSGELTVGSLVLISHYAIGLFGPFRQFARQAAQTGRTIACAERLTKIIEKEPAITDVPGAVELLHPPQKIILEDISIKNSKKYRVSRKWMLSNVSFEINSGERIAIIGKNGSGKSTLLKLLLRLYDPQIGRIFMDDKDIRHYSLKSLRNNFSVVFQDSIFFGLTLKENITFGNPSASAEEIEACTTRCGINEWIAGLKRGYETTVQRHGSLFSGGEKQKLAVARALLNNGNIWLLDEPTNDLDESSRLNIIKLLIEVTENKTTFWVTHDRSVLPYFSRVLLLDEGKIVFFGTPEEFESWIKSNSNLSIRIDQLLPGLVNMGGI